MARRGIGSTRQNRAPLDPWVEPAANGPDRVATERSLMGALALADEALAAAARSYGDVLCVLERSVGAAHPEIARVHRRLADACHGRGCLVEAEAHARTALAIRTAALGPGHPEAAADRAALGLLIAEQGRRAEGAGLLKHALDTFEVVLGPDSPEAVFLRQELGSRFDDAGPSLAVSGGAGSRWG